jgi:hypothetical protein
MAGQQSRPGGRSQAANDDAENSVTGTSDNRITERDWLRGVVDVWPQHSVIIVAAEVARFLCFETFELSCPEISKATGIPLPTVWGCVAGLVRNGWFIRERRARPDRWVTTEATQSGHVGRWVPAPGLYRIAIGGDVWQGRGRRGRYPGGGA